MFSQFKRIITHEIFEPIRELFYSVIFGSNKITSVYSTEGVLTKTQFLVIIVALSFIYSFFEYFHNSLLTYIAELFLFYAVLTAVQKRCRDFGSSGTFWILIVSCAFIGNMAFHFINIETEEFLRDIHKYVFNFQIITFLALFLIPSKPKPDLELRSPLLKYPLLYVALCWVLAISATWIVSRYTQTGFTFF